ncbi:hypothetical protein XA68_11176 [Ophiocordyceps unilateralis]|uniref:Uncharacterized protein n=1 Tax=Ophiocordyceps unilateralis TaxID=268505 RepID=A0A2A9PHC3_OPHUN|nr:hypothetical protein XA68_11176 [Ophiocordyceps unilateralis]
MASLRRHRNRQLDPEPGGRQTARKTTHSLLAAAVTRARDYPKGALKDAAKDFLKDAAKDVPQDISLDVIRVHDAATATAGDAAEESIDDAAREAAHSVTGDAIIKVARNAAEVSGRVAAHDAAWDAAKHAAWDAARDAARNATQNATVDPVKDDAENTANDVPSTVTATAIVFSRVSPLDLPEKLDDANGNLHFIVRPPPKSQRWLSKRPAMVLQSSSTEPPTADQMTAAQAAPAPTTADTGGQHCKFNAAAFDTAIYSQAGAMKPPAGVSVPPRRKRRLSGASDDRVYVHANPVIHRAHNRSQEWHKEKAREIQARGGRKVWFGRVMERIQWRRRRESRSNQSARLTTPQPWTFSRPLDFGDVPESELPEAVLENAGWVKACAWHRETRRMMDLRHQESLKSEAETRQFYVDVMQSIRPSGEERRTGSEDDISRWETNNKQVTESA